MFKGVRTSFNGLYCIDDKMVMTSFSNSNRKKWIIIFKILSAFQVKVLNFGGSISKGFFLKHQISREKVLWEVENNNPNPFSPRKSVREDILIRPFVCGWVSTCESEWVRDSVTIFPWGRDTDLYFCPITFKLHTWEEESYWFLVTESKIKDTLGYDTDFSFVPNHFETAQISCLWRKEEFFWYGVTGLEAKLNHGTLPKNYCGHDAYAGYRLCSITLKVHTHVFND